MRRVFWGSPIILVFVALFAPLAHAGELLKGSGYSLQVPNDFRALPNSGGVG